MLNFDSQFLSCCQCLWQRIRTYDRHACSFCDFKSLLFVIDIGYIDRPFYGVADMVCSVAFAGLGYYLVIRYILVSNCQCTVSRGKVIIHNISSVFPFILKCIFGAANQCLRTGHCNFGYSFISYPASCNSYIINFCCKRCTVIILFSIR